MSKTLKCANCGGAVAQNFGIVDRAKNVIDLCSPKCRAEARMKPAGQSSSAKTVSSMTDQKKRARKPDTRPRETDISKTIGDDLKISAAYESRLQSGQVEIVKGKGEKRKSFYMHLATAGTPDRIGAKWLVMFFEVKRQGEQPTDEQKRVQNDLRDNGALVFVVDNYDDYNFIRQRLNYRAERLKRIAAEIREIQNEIDSEMEQRKIK